MNSASYLSGSLDQVFEQSAIPALRKLFVEETPTGVEISGSVPSYYYKQMAQEAILPVLGPRRLLNRVTVIQTEALGAKAMRAEWARS